MKAVLLSIKIDLAFVKWYCFESIGYHRYFYFFIEVCFMINYAFLKIGADFSIVTWQKASGSL